MFWNAGTRCFHMFCLRKKYHNFSYIKNKVCLVFFSSKATKKCKLKKTKNRRMPVDFTKKPKKKKLLQSFFFCFSTWKVLFGLFFTWPRRFYCQYNNFHNFFLENIFPMIFMNFEELFIMTNLILLKIQIHMQYESKENHKCCIWGV